MPERVKDETGNVYGRLTVIKRDGCDNSGAAKWLCKCECGKTVSVRGIALRKGTTRSCGCYSAEYHREKTKKFNTDNPRLYRIWNTMKLRCRAKSQQSYKYYGSRGINVCKEWDNFDVFAEWASTHGYADNLSLDRIDPSGNYEPDNCRWVTMKEQANNKRTSRWFVFEGKKMTMQQIADKYGIPTSTLFNRLKRGMNIYDAVTVPIQPTNKKYHVICIDTNEVFESIHDAGKKYGVRGESIASAIHGRSETSGGVRWRYLET